MDVKLVLFRDTGERRDFPLSPGRTTVGRKDDCDIRIPVAEVSRRHCEFRASDGGIDVKDLESANGTYVNNKRVSNSQKLAPGDHVIVGPVVFTVQIDGQPKEIRPVKTRLRTRATAPAEKSGSASGQEEVDPISALEALASSADQTALDPFDEEDEEP